MAKLSEVPVELQELEETEGRLETLDLNRLGHCQVCSINCCILQDDM